MKLQLSLMLGKKWLLFSEFEKVIAGNDTLTALLSFEFFLVTLTWTKIVDPIKVLSRVTEVGYCCDKLHKD